jgi:hypothetical protein
MLFYEFSNITVFVLVGAVLIIALLILHSSRSLRVPAIGLTMMYFFGIASNSIPGALVLTKSWFEYVPKYMVYTGFVATAIAIFSFSLGVLVVHFLSASTRKPLDIVDPDRNQSILLDRFGIMLLFISLVSTAITPFVGNIDSFSAVVSAGFQLSTIAAFLFIYKRQGSLLSRIGLTICLVFFPVYQLVLNGFLGFGVTFIVTILIFLVVTKRVPVLLLIASPLLAYTLFSFIISYLVARDDYRAVIWEDVTLGERVQAFDNLLSRFEWFDSENELHLRAIDGRINQNWLFGAAIEAVSNGKTEISGGKSMRDATVAWIPRAIWPNKPNVAGSGSLVSDITGIQFSETTAIGISHWLEFYANFGMLGVVFGMFLLGVVIRMIDIQAGDALRTMQLDRFILFSLIGIAFLSSLSSMAESISSLVVLSALATVAIAVRTMRYPDLAGSRMKPASMLGA